MEELYRKFGLAPKTNIDLDQHFEHDFIKLNTKREVLIDIDMGHNVNRCIWFHKGSAKIGKDCHLEPVTNDPHTYKWKPKSHTRDFTTFHPFTDDELILARGQYIGLILIEEYRAYIIIYWDDDKDDNTKISFICENYRKQSVNEVKAMIATELSNGVNVLYIRDGVSFNLCEKEDKRDKRETHILFPQFKKYAGFEKNFK